MACDYRIFYYSKIVIMIKIKFNENNPSIIFLYLNSLEEYIKIINSIVIIKLMIDIHIIFSQTPF